MRINIEYDSSWRNSFLSGSNDQPLNKDIRNFIATSKNINAKDKTFFLETGLSKNTIMGVLNRLIGDQRKLYQSRNDENYYFQDLEDKISFEDHAITTQEIVFLRNMNKGSFDKVYSTGPLVDSSPITSSNYSKELWSVIFLDISEIIKFILNDDYVVNVENCPKDLDENIIDEKMNLLLKHKRIELDENGEAALEKLRSLFPDGDYKLKDDKFSPIAFYTSGIYLQHQRLREKYPNILDMLTKMQKIAGFSKCSYTPKDFLKQFMLGDKKIVYGTPYLREEKLKFKQKERMSLTKASGLLIINLDITETEALDLYENINDASVSAFKLGKKGLAYISHIEL